MLHVGWMHRVRHQSACWAQALNYELAEGVSIDDLAEEDRLYLGDGYKRTVLEHMSTSQLLDMLLIHPTVSVSPSYRDTGLTASYTFKPLSNLVGPPSNFRDSCRH
jgi:arginine deiminase